MKTNVTIAGMLLVGLLALGTGCDDGGTLSIGDATAPGTSTASGSTNPSPTPTGDLSGRVTDD